MKIATWNVNGIRARHAQVQEWVEREQPDIVCLQEIKAVSDQVPAALCEMEGYWCYWHGTKGYSGVGLHVRKALCPERPAFGHPDFDYESRIVTVDVNGVTFASIYVPNGGKDFQAKMRFLEALRMFTEDLHAGGRPAILCGDLNIARADIDVHPKERKPRAIGQLPEERALLERIIANGLVDTGRALEPDNDQTVHVVGAVEEHEGAQHRLAPRLRARQPGALRPGPGLRDPAGVRHQRPRTGRRVV